MAILAGWQERADAGRQQPRLGAVQALAGRQARGGKPLVARRLVITGVVEVAYERLCYRSPHVSRGEPR